MRIPAMQGIIQRRILVNYRVDPQVIQKLLPARFRPKLYDGHAIAGICLIHLEQLRPKMMPEFIGVASENAAHRIAVLWDDETGATREGVFIPRRDTNSPLNYLLGGRIFPGEHHAADFRVEESENQLNLAMRSRDGHVAVQVSGRIVEGLPPTSVFRSLADASSFFEAGALGYSLTRSPHRLEGLRLETMGWRVDPLAVQQVYSSYFADEQTFPKGSVEFDHALLMSNLAHEWHTASDLYV